MTLRNLQIVRSGASEVSAPHAFSKPINHHQARQKLTKHHACTNVNQRRPAVLSVETPLPSELDALCWHATVATNSANCCVVVSFFRTRGDCRVGFRLCPDVHANENVYSQKRTGYTTAWKISQVHSRKAHATSHRQCALFTARAPRRANVTTAVHRDSNSSLALPREPA